MSKKHINFCAPIPIRLTAAQLKKINQKKLKTGISVSGLIRLAVTEFLKERK